jgi:hypothetical protein
MVALTLPYNTCFPVHSVGLSPHGKYGVAFGEYNIIIVCLHAPSKKFVAESKGDSAPYSGIGSGCHHHHFLPCCLWVMPPLVQSLDSPKGLFCCSCIIFISWDLQHWSNAIFIGEE